MSRDILLLRHGKSSWDNPELRDIERPLNVRGKEAARAMGRHVRDLDLLPDFVFCSPAQRTRQTLKLFFEGARTRRPEAVIEDSLYHGTANSILNILCEAPDSARRVMVIGHNPSMQGAAIKLARAGEAGLIAEMTAHYPTAALAHFTLGRDDFSVASGDGARLVHYIKPRSLAGQQG